MPSKPWFEIRNAASEKGPAEILIYDQIGKSFWDASGVGAKEFAEALKAIPQDREILVCINSPGGNVYDGLAIYHQLQARSAYVVCRIDGLAASIASVIACAGRETRMPRNALMMIHNASGLARGNSAEMRKMAALLDKIQTVIVGIYHAKTGKPLADLQAAMSAETWYTGAEAQAAGLVDTVTEEVALTASFDLSNFKSPPRSLLPLLGERAGVRAELPPSPGIRAERTPIDSQLPSDAASNAANQNMNPAPTAETLSLLDKLKALFAPAPVNQSADPAEELRATITRQEQEIADLKAAATNAQTAQAAAVKEAGSREAATILAKAGVPPLPVKPDGAAAGAPERNQAELWAEYRRINAADGPRKAREFYVAHKAKM